MKNQAQLSHVAFLVSSVAESSAFTTHLGFYNGPAERFEGEGTLEVYVGDPKQNGRLLLMEAIHDGAYRHALLKRGPGLHHVAIDVLDLESYISDLSGSGWFLHPRSLETIEKSRTAYLARPGIAMLIEVQEREKLDVETRFITKIELPSSRFDVVRTLDMPELIPSKDGQIWLTCDGRRFEAAQLLGNKPENSNLKETLIRKQGPEFHLNIIKSISSWSSELEALLKPINESLLAVREKIRTGEDVSIPKLQKLIDEQDKERKFSEEYEKYLKEMKPFDLQCRGLSTSLIIVTSGEMKRVATLVAEIFDFYDQKSDWDQSKVQGLSPDIKGASWAEALWAASNYIRHADEWQLLLHCRCASKDSRSEH